MKKKKRIWLLFIDTETTGLSYSDQIIQFAAIYGIFDWKNFQEEIRINQYINITKEINPFAQRVHKISKSMVEKYDYIDWYIDTFMEYVEKSDCVIWHNISFDMRMLRQDCERIWREHNLESVRTFCTMKDTCDCESLTCKKRPKLRILYNELFGRNFENAHDAMADIEATKDCFLELMNRGEICLCLD